MTKDMALKSKLAVYEAAAEDGGRALSDIAKALKESPHDRDVLYNAALVYELTNRRDQALLMLDSANKAGYPAEEIRKEPELARLRADPRFARLSLQ